MHSILNPMVLLAASSREQSVEDIFNSAAFAIPRFGIKVCAVCLFLYSLMKAVTEGYAWGNAGADLTAAPIRPLIGLGVAVWIGFNPDRVLGFVWGIGDLFEAIVGLFI